jgi:hypothetical protein
MIMLKSSALFFKQSQRRRIFRRPSAQMCPDILVRSVVNQSLFISRKKFSQASIVLNQDRASLSFMDLILHSRRIDTVGVPSDIAVMDKEGNPVILVQEPECQAKGRYEYDTVGNSTVFGSQGASISVCPDSLPGVCDQPHGFTFSQGSNLVPSTQDEENLLCSDPSYCQEKCITVESIKALGALCMSLLYSLESGQ